MSRNRKTITETVADREIANSNQGSGRNGHSRAAQFLSWYLAQPRVKGLVYALTANGYAILPNGLPRSRKQLDANKLMMLNYQ